MKTKTAVLWVEGRQTVLGKVYTERERALLALAVSQTIEALGSEREAVLHFEEGE